VERELRINYYLTASGDRALVLYTPLRLSHLNLKTTLRIILIYILQIKGQMF
jgi:hypothetical protein